MDFVLTQKDNTNGISLAWYEKKSDTIYTQNALNFSPSYIGDAPIETVDIDNDGDTDIVFVEQIPKKLTLFRNNRTGKSENSGLDRNIQNSTDLKLDDLNNDGKLDITSFKLIAASHNVKLISLNDRQIHFIFKKINLAASSYNEPNNHGFVKNSIKTQNNLNPDPFSDYFTLQMEHDPMGICDLIILDILGRKK